MKDWAGYFLGSGLGVIVAGLLLYAVVTGGAWLFLVLLDAVANYVT